MSEGTGASGGGEWVALSAEEAEKHPLYGIAGWLSAVWAWLAIQIILDFFRAVGYFMFSSETAVPGAVASLVSIIIAVLTLFHLFYLRPAFPAWLAVNAGFSIVIIVFASAVALAVFALNVAILCYALFSRRVNITYRRRARPEWLPRRIDIPPVEKQEDGGPA
jgi:hypothetical protein